MKAYYNEIDPYAAQWIRNLITAGLVSPGDVDQRDIRDVVPSDLEGYTRCHFFAGVAIWDHALALAGWPEDRKVWTGSCPCQPFSAAGKGGGVSDERHLWPAFFHLIERCQPPIILGEQVASSDGLDWLDLVQADLEGANYNVAAVDLCAAGVGAPHIRQRLWFVADAKLSGTARQRGDSRTGETAPGLRDGSADRGFTRGVAQSSEPGPQRRVAAGERPVAQLAAPERGGASGFLGDSRRQHDEHVAGSFPDPQGSIGRWRGDGYGGASSTGVMGDARGVRRYARFTGDERGEEGARGEYGAEPSGSSFWSNPDWIPCRDGKARPVEPGTFPLAHGSTSRVGRLRAYGNAIVPQVAATFIAAVMDVRQ